MLEKKLDRLKILCAASRTMAEAIDGGVKVLIWLIWKVTVMMSLAGLVLTGEPGWQELHYLI